VKTTLVLETSTDHGGVALFEGETLRARETFGAGRRHSALLFSVLERLVPRPGHGLGRIVVGLGPGSYAGVRIAIAAATGLSLATGAELLGLPSLAALAQGDYIALGDARRGSFYFAIVREGSGVEPGGPRLVEEAELSALLARPEWSALPVFSPDSLPSIPRAQVRHPDAERLGRLALAGRGITARGQLEPIYLREASITLSSKPLPTFPVQ